MKIFKNVAIVLFVCFSFVLLAGNKVSAKTISQNISFKSYAKHVDGLKISWNNSKKANGYVIYRKEGEGSYVKYDTTSSNTYIDKDADPETVYTYAVKAYTKNKKGKKAYAANKVEFDSVNGVVKGVNTVILNEQSDSRNHISWNGRDSVSGYIVYRSVNGSEFSPVSIIKTNATDYEDTDIVPGYSYKYRIVSYEHINGNTYESAISSDAAREYKYGFDERGIDVSHHNGYINWKKVKKAGIKFAMIRVGYGTTKGGIVDRQFVRNYKNARKNGIKVGIYLYSYADNKKEAKNEAKFTCKMLKKYNKLDYPVAFDFEETYRNRTKYKSSNTNIIKTYCSYVEKKGYDTIVYSFADFLQKAVYHKKISKYGIWLAKWSSKFSNCGIDNVQIWQYSDCGRVKGMGTNCDMNYKF